jgi:hypothetical protein
VQIYLDRRNPMDCISQNTHMQDSLDELPPRYSDMTECQSSWKARSRLICRFLRAYTSQDINRSQARYTGQDESTASAKSRISSAELFSERKRYLTLVLGPSLSSLLQTDKNWYLLQRGSHKQHALYSEHYEHANRSIIQKRQLSTSCPVF